VIKINTFLRGDNKKIEEIYETSLYELTNNL